MPDRNKVIKDLEEIKEYTREKAKDLGSRKCRMLDKIGNAITLLKEQEDCIRILTSDLEDLQKEHEKLLDKKIPLITNGQEVVRCKECKHWRQNTEFCGRWSVGNVAQHTPPDWFCADGERR